MLEKLSVLFNTFIVADLQLRVHTKNNILFSTQTYVVDTLKNHLNKLVLLGTQNIGKKCVSGNRSAKFK